MRNKMKLSPNVKQKTSISTTLVYATAGIAIAAVVGSILFFYLNLGNNENAYSKPPSTSTTSTKNGNWSSNGTWDSKAPKSSGLKNSTINIDHQVTRNGSISTVNHVTMNISAGSILTITGSLVVNNHLDLNVEGTLIILGSLTVNSHGAISVSGGGNMVVEGASSFNAHTDFDIDGDVQFKGNTTFGDNTEMTIGSSGNLTTNDDLSFGDDADIVNDGLMDIGNNLSFNSSPDRFNGSGSVLIGGEDCSAWEGSGGCTDNITLPVELLGFYAEASDNEVVITWKTATELNNDFFRLQRSRDAEQFSDIAKVKGNGTTNNVSEYTYVDKNPVNGIAYYRLIQTDFDGTSETFRPVSVEMAISNNEIIVYPNPIRDNKINVRFSQPQEGRIEVVDQSGNVIIGRDISTFDNQVTMQSDRELAPGMYFLRYKADGQVETIKLMKR